MVYSIPERKFILETYLKTKSCNKVRELFIEKFNKNGPLNHYICNLFSKFRETGSVLNKKHNRRPHVLTEEKLEQIKQSFERSPRKGLRHRGQNNGISKTSCGRAAKKSKFHPYRVSVVHELKPADYVKRVKYCEWFLKFIENDSVLLINYTFFTDEAWFHLSGYVNSQNTRVWATKNPHEFIESSLHPLKIGVWCAISRKRIIGPIFFENIINSQEYLRIIQEFISELDEEEINECYFQQDGASCHTSQFIAPHLTYYY